MQKWNDEYWPLLIQLYRKKPEGVKPLYSRDLVEISLNLHITPEELMKRMRELSGKMRPALQKLCDEYTASPRKLVRDVKTIHQMHGFGDAKKFYDGVYTNETFERDFRPVKEREDIIPAMLILILDLYFQLTPSTMTTSTNEVQQLAKLLHLKASEVIDIMEVFLFIDPYHNQDDIMLHPLLFACHDIWERFGNNIEKLSYVALDMTAYFK